MKRMMALLAVTGALGGCGSLDFAQLEAPMAVETQARSQVSPRYTQAMQQAIQWVKANAGGDYDPRPGKLFPDLDCGNLGLKAYAVNPDASQALLDLNRAAVPGLRLPKVTFDPTRHLVLMVVATWDEPITYTAVMDRRTGKARVYGDFNILDGGHNLSERDFSRTFPRFAGKPDTDGWELLADLIQRSTWLKLTPQDTYWDAH